ncbi:MAG: protein kinase [Myxococcales bacterium]
MQHDALPSVGDTVGNYQVLRRIGAGGMGVVFEALNVDTDGKVALKFLSPELLNNPEAVKRFRLEAKATGRIQHPNVVAVHNIGEHRGQLYLVMEFLRGRSLREELSKGLFDVARALEVMFPVMRGVAAAHAVGVLHRDLKPENIFLAESPDGLAPIPKVLDFGIAKLTSEVEGTHGGASARTAFMGTYQYMAFEQLHARKDLDGRVDVYALGTVLYHVVTGALPYRADNPVDLALAMLQSDPMPANYYTPSLPEGFSEVLNMALARDRDQRFPDIEAFAQALTPYANGGVYKGSGDSRPLRAPGPHASHKTPAPGAFTPPPRSPDSGRVPGVFSSPTPFVVRKDYDDTAPPRPQRSSGLLWIGGSTVAAALGFAGYMFLRPANVAPPPLPTAPAAQAERPGVPTSPVSAAMPRAALPADAGAENDDWAAAGQGSAAPQLQAPPQLQPQRVEQQPTETRGSNTPELAIDPRAGQPEHSRQRPSTQQPRETTSSSHERTSRPRRETQGTSEGAPRTRSGLGVSSEEF